MAEWSLIHDGTYAGPRVEMPTFVVPASALAQAEADLAHYKFHPLGDNHHNAAVCPYCSPDRQAYIDRAEQAEAERDRLRERVMQLEDELETLLNEQERPVEAQAEAREERLREALRVVMAGPDTDWPFGTVLTVKGVARQALKDSDG